MKIKIEPKIFVLVVLICVVSITNCAEPKSQESREAVVNCADVSAADEKYVVTTEVSDGGNTVYYLRAFDSVPTRSIANQDNGLQVERIPTRQYGKCLFGRKNTPTEGIARYSIEDGQIKETGFLAATGAVFGQIEFASGAKAYLAAPHQSLNVLIVDAVNMAYSGQIDLTQAYADIKTALAGADPAYMAPSTLTIRGNQLFIGIAMGTNSTKIDYAATAVVYVNISGANAHTYVSGNIIVNDGGRPLPLMRLRESNWYGADSSGNIYLHTTIIPDITVPNVARMQWVRIDAGSTSFNTTDYPWNMPSSVYEFNFNPAGSSVLKMPVSTVLNEQGKGTFINFECANDGTGLSNKRSYFGACARTMFTVNQGQFYSIDLGARTVTKLPNIPLVNIKYRTGEFFDGLQYIPVNTKAENAIYTVNLDTNATAKAFTISDGAVYSIVKFTKSSFK